MTARVVDLGRVRRALARLDAVLRDHPELASAEARERLAVRLDAEEKGGDAGRQAGADEEREAGPDGAGTPADP